MRNFALLAFVWGSLLGASDEVGSRPLASFVPDGAVFAVRVHALRDSWHDLANTPLASAVWNGPIRQHLEASGKLAEMKAGLAKAENDLGITLGKTLMQLAGNEAILAVYPGDSPDKPKVGLFLRGLPDVDAAQIIDPLLTRLTNVGELQAIGTVPIESTELKRFRNKKGEEFGVLTHGNHTLIVNASEIASGAASLASGMRSDSILANPRLTETCAPLADDAQILAFLDIPRILQVSGAPIDQQFAQAPYIAAAIKAIKGIALGVSVRGDGVRSCLRFAVDENALPDFIRAYHAQPDQTSDFAANLPKTGVMAAMFTRIDFAALVKEITNRLPPEAKSGLDQNLAGVNAFFLGGKSLTNDLLPALGPDIGVILTDLDPNDKTPADLTLLLKINNPAGKEILSTVARSLYGMTQFAPDPQEAAKTSLKEDGDTLILSRAEKDLTPAALVMPNALIVGTSLAAATQIKDWLKNPPAENLAATLPAFKTGFLGADLAALGKWIIANKAALAADRVTREGISAERAQAETAVLGEFITRFRSLAIMGHGAPNAFEVQYELSL
jgi:hypothetical protein